MFVTLPIVAYPDNPAAHIVRNQWFGSVTVREDHQAVILMFVGIVDGLLERGSAASDDCDVSHDLLQGLNHTDSAVKLDNIHLGEAIAECAVDDAVEVGQVFGRDGSAHIHRHQQLGVETADGPHILETSAAVGAHAGKFAHRGEDTGTEAGQDIPPVDAGTGGRLEHLGEAAGQRAPVLCALNDTVDEGKREFVLLPELGQRGLPLGRIAQLVGAPVGFAVTGLGLTAGRRKELLDAAGVPLVGLTFGQFIIFRALDIEIAESVVVTDGKVAADCDSLLAAGIRLSLVRMFQQDTDSLGTQCLVQSRITHFVRIGRVVLDCLLP